MQNLIKKLRIKGLHTLTAEISGRGETPPNILAKQEDEDGIRIQLHPVGKPQPPLIYRTEDYMVRVIIVGKGWLKEEMCGVRG